MDSVIEKITLYDILGYAIPGYMFLLIIGLNYMIGLDHAKLQVYEDYTGYIMFIFLLLGYVVGIILSEVSRAVVSLCELFWELAKKIFRINLSDVVDAELVILALKKSKLVKQDDSITDISKKYYKIMYSDIQTDSAYKRIHNYASAKMMYKNLVGSFCMGILWNRYIVPVDDYSKVMCWICLGAAIVFGVRWYRFDKKTRRYTILWFVKKYVSSE